MKGVNPDTHTISVTGGKEVGASEFNNDDSLTMIFQVYKQSDLYKLTCKDDGVHFAPAGTGSSFLFGEPLSGSAAYAMIEKDGKTSSLLFIFDKLMVEAIPIDLQSTAYVVKDANDNEIEALPGLNLKDQTIILEDTNGDPLTTKPEVKLGSKPLTVVASNDPSASSADATYNSSDGTLAFSTTQDIKATDGDVLMITPAAVDISSVTLAGFVAPKFNGTPVAGGTGGVTRSDDGVKSLTADSVVWEGELSTDKTFKGEVSYKVTITLEAQDGYRFDDTMSITDASSALTTDAVTDANPNGYKVAEGGKTMTITQTFPALADVKITQWAFSKDKQEVSVAIGDSSLDLSDFLTVKANPSNTDNEKVIWESDNEKVAQVGANTGLITPVTIGTANITVTSAVDSTKTGTCKLTVTAEPQKVTGQVNDASTHTGVANIDVKLWKVNDDGTLAETTYTAKARAADTGAGIDLGLFEFPAVAPGSYKVKTAQTDLYDETLSEVVEVKGAAATVTAFNLNPRTYDVALQAIDDNGKTTDKVTLSLKKGANDVPVTDGVAKLACGGAYNLYDQNGDTGITLNVNAAGTGEITASGTIYTAVTASTPDAETKASTVKVQYYTVNCSVTAKDNAGADLPAAAVRASSAINGQNRVDILGQLVLAGSSVTFNASVGATAPQYKWDPKGMTLSATTGATVTLANLIGTTNIACAITAAKASDNAPVTLKMQKDNVDWDTSDAPTADQFYLMAGETRYELTGAPAGGTYDIYMSDGKGGGYNTLSTVTAGGAAGELDFYTVEFKVSDNGAVTKGACIQATYHGTDTPSAANRSEGSVVVLKGQPVSFKINLPSGSEDQTYTYDWTSNSDSLGTEPTAKIDKVIKPYTTSDVVECTLDSKLNIISASIDPAKVELKKAGETKTLTLKILPTDIVPGDVTNYKWSSSDTSVVTVNPTNGTAEITAVKEGTATITATFEYNGEVYTETVPCQVTVGDVQTADYTEAASKVEKTCTYADTVANTAEAVEEQLTTAVNKIVEGLKLPTTGIVITVGTDFQAAVPGTETTPKGQPGSFTFKVTFPDGKTVEGTGTITTTDFSGGDTPTPPGPGPDEPDDPNPPTPPTPVITGVTVTPATLSMTVGTMGTVTAVVQKDGEDDATEKVTWTSSNPDVATVADGTVTAVKAGNTTITATSVTDTSKSASCEVTVNAKPVEPVVETENIKGETKADLAEGVEDPDGKLLETAKSVEADEKVLGDNASTNAVVQGELAAMGHTRRGQTRHHHLPGHQG